MLILGQYDSSRRHSFFQETDLLNPKFFALILSQSRLLVHSQPSDDLVHHQGRKPENLFRVGGIWGPGGSTTTPTRGGLCGKRGLKWDSELLLKGVRHELDLFVVDAFERLFLFFLDGRSSRLGEPVAQIDERIHGRGALTHAESTAIVATRIADEVATRGSAAIVVLG